MSKANSRRCAWLICMLGVSLLVLQSAAAFKIKPRVHARSKPHNVVPYAYMAQKTISNSHTNRWEDADAANTKPISKPRGGRVKNGEAGIPVSGCDNLTVAGNARPACPDSEYDGLAYFVCYFLALSLGAIPILRFFQAIWVPYQSVAEHSETCHFCQRDSATHSERVALYGDVTKERTGFFSRPEYSWNSAEVYIPACVHCVRRYLWLRALLAISILSFASCVFVPWVAVFSSIGCLIFGWKCYRVYSRKRQYPQLRDLIAAGWRVGDKPPGVK